MPAITASFKLLSLAKLNAGLALGVAKYRKNASLMGGHPCWASMRGVGSVKTQIACRGCLERRFGVFSVNQKAAHLSLRSRISARHLFVSQNLELNRECLRELRAAEERRRGVAGISDIIQALIGPSLRRCLGADAQNSTAARFMIRAKIEPVPAIRRIRSQELDHLRKFIAAMKRALPDRREDDLYWNLHFALAMAQQTVRDAERLTKLSEGKCGFDDVEGIIARVVKVIVMALRAEEAEETVSRNEGQLLSLVPRGTKLRGE